MKFLEGVGYLFLIRLDQDYWILDFLGCFYPSISAWADSLLSARAISFLWNPSTRKFRRLPENLWDVVLIQVYIYN